MAFSHEFGDSTSCCRLLVFATKPACSRMCWFHMLVLYPGLADNRGRCGCRNGLCPCMMAWCPFCITLNSLEWLVRRPWFSLQLSSLPGSSLWMPATQLLIWVFVVDGCHGRRDRPCHAFLDCHVCTLALPALAASLCQSHVAEALCFFVEVQDFGVVR